MNKRHALLLTVGFLCSGFFAQAQVLVSETLAWKAKSGLSFNSCEGCKTLPVSIPGPGTIAIRLQMEPYQRREFMTSNDSILGTPGLDLVAKLVQTTYNGSRTVPASQLMVGKPADLVQTWSYTQPKPMRFNLEIRSPLKCGGNDCDQRAANAQITVTYTPAGSETSAPKTLPGTPAAMGHGSLAGTWVRNQGSKVIDRIDIVASGDGFKLNLREGDDRPLYASGFGVLQGNRLASMTRNANTGNVGLVVITPQGEKIHYRSYYEDGRVAWEGEFFRRK